MNNTKWEKFFSLFVSEDLPSRATIVKCIATEETTLDLLYEGSSRLYISYDIIEWVFIPTAIERKRFNRTEKLQSTFKKVNLPDFIEKLDTLGKYEYDFDDQGLKIFGYK